MQSVKGGLPAGPLLHAATHFLGREPRILDRRLGGALHANDGVWLRVDHRGCAQGYRRRSGRHALDSSARQFTRLARLWRRRHPHGPHRRSCRHALDRYLRCLDDRRGPRTLHLSPPWPLWIGHGFFIGLNGLGGINAPMYVYISRWFDRRRGSALALISSGSYLAGALWPPLFERVIAAFGWRQTMLWYALAEIVVIVPVAALYFPRPPEVIHATTGSTKARASARVFNWRPNSVFALMCGAAVLCCIPMAMPQGHLVAFCSDLGIARSIGALMLSVLLGTAFLSRQIWGAISDRIGGLATVLIGSAWQAAAMVSFLLTQNEVGLFTVAAAFGLGFSGIIPAYVLALRELFPPAEAYWRIPTLLLFSGGGMALGGWIAGLLYDYFGYYAPAFAAGIGANMLNLLIVGLLVARKRTRAVWA